MRRNDTTARKWNSSRPTYDEDWSDEEYAAEASPTRNSVSAQRETGPSTLAITKVPLEKAPWEVDSPDKPISSSSAFFSKGGNNPVSVHTTTIEPDTRDSTSSRRVYSLHDGPVRMRTPEIDSFDAEVNYQVDLATHHSPTVLQAEEETVTDNVIEQESHQSHTVSHSGDPSSAATQHKSVVVEAGSEEAAGSTHPSSSATSLLDEYRSFDEDEIVADEDETMRLNALMFNPENLTASQHLEEEKEASATSDKVYASTRSIDNFPQDKMLSQMNFDESNQKAIVPEFPNDFRDGLKSRALSDAILETLHSTSQPEDMQRSSSNDRHESNSTATTERTPSIVLTTNAWAEKSRLLKEQLEKNKRLKEMQKEPVVRESTYDHEYEYQMPLARLPTTEENATSSAESEGANIYAEDLYNLHAPEAQSNLNTLLEEEEEDESIPKAQARKAINSNLARKRLNSQPPPASSPKSISPTRNQHGDSKRISLPLLPQESSTSASPYDIRPPSPAKSFDTNKSLPVLVTNDQSSKSSESDSDSASQHSMEDDTLSPEQEFALLKTLELRHAAPQESLSKEKALPPIIVHDPKPNKSVLPAIQTNIATRKPIAEAPVVEAYTPSEYSAFPSADAPPVHEQLSQSPSKSHQLLPSLPVADAVEPNKQFRSTEPIAKGWEPLRSVHRDIAQPTSDISRFSTSTTQSVEAADDYRFDMRDSFNPAMYSTLEDKPYYSDDDTQAQDVPAHLSVPGNQREPSLRSSTSVATLQPALRHMQSSLSIGAEKSSPKREMESERLAEELLQQLSMTHTAPQMQDNAAPEEKITEESRKETVYSQEIVPSTLSYQEVPRGLSHSNPASGDTSDRPLETEDTITPSAKFGARGRTASAGSKFLEVMSPMTSMEQSRVTNNNTTQMQLSSEQLLRFKDIKELHSVQQRTAEYRRRTKALQENSSGLREYLLAIATRFEGENRAMPGPAPHVEIKSSKSIIPDKFVPTDLSRTTARIGDKGKDAAKELLSKSTRGLKGLFHSNSRSVSGSKKANISLPLESKEQDRAGRLFKRSSHGADSTATTVVPPYQQNLMAPSTPRSPQNPHILSPLHNQGQGYGPARLSSPVSHRSHGSPGRNRAQTPPFGSPTLDSPQSSPTQRTSARPTSASTATISRIKGYFPDRSDREIGDALMVSDMDEQRAIGYLVVNRQPR